MTEIAQAAGAPPRGWQREVPMLLALALPLTLTNLVEHALTTTNIMLIGRLGSVDLGATVLATNLYFCIVIPGIALVTAVSPLIARDIGADPEAFEDVRRTMRQGFWSAALLSAVIIAILIFAEPILRRLGQDAQISALAAQYGHLLMLGAPPFLGYIVLRSVAAALGRPRAALWAALLAIPCNAALGYALIHGAAGLPALGMRGPALATALSTWLMLFVLGVLIALDPHLRRYRLFHRLFRFDSQRFAELWRLGVPIGVAVAFETSIFSVAAMLMGIVGRDALAAHGIALQICSLTFMVPLGIAQAATVRVGLAYGAQDRHGIAVAGSVAYAIGVGFMVMTALVMLLAPRALLSAFLDTSDPANMEVMRLGVLFLFFGGLFQIVDGAQVVAAGMLRGLHDATIPMIYAGLGYWVIGMPLALLLCFHFGLGGVGIWIALASGLAAVAVLMTTRWVMRERLGLTRAKIASTTA